LADNKNRKIAPAEGKLAIVISGMGAVFNTLIVGVEALKRRLSKPIGNAGVLEKSTLATLRNIRLLKLKNTLRWMKGEQLITHLGMEYYG